MKIIKRKIVILSSIPVTSVNIEKLQIESYADFGWEVEVWDLSLCAYSVDRLNGYFSGNCDYKYSGEKVSRFESISQLADMVNKNVNAVFWVLAGFYKSELDKKICNIINRKRIMYSFYHNTIEYSSLTKATKSLGRLVKNIIVNISDPVKLILVSGKISAIEARVSYPFAKVLETPSIHLCWKCNERIINKKYVVFVDEVCVSPPDVHLYCSPTCTDLDGYYSRMREVFKKIEKALGIPVVIAASNKYIYPDPRKYFADRSIVYGKTLELIQHTELVIGHVSMALQQAIPSRKPVLLISDPSFTKEKTAHFYIQENLFRSKYKVSNLLSESDIFAKLQADLSFYDKKETLFFRTKKASESYLPCFLNTLNKLFCC